MKRRKNHVNKKQQQNKKQKQQQHKNIEVFFRLNKTIVKRKAGSNKNQLNKKEMKDLALTV